MISVFVSTNLILSFQHNLHYTRRITPKRVKQRLPIESYIKFDAKFFIFFARLFILFYRSPISETLRAEKNFRFHFMK